jgi:pimeloyl-ACP methyl ester carboxylesterase/putative sterol carrier protein
MKENSRRGRQLGAAVQKLSGVVVRDVLQLIQQQARRSWRPSALAESIDPLESALRSRIARPSASAAQKTARICFQATDAGKTGVWTILFEKGEVTLAQGRPSNVSATLVAKQSVLIDVLEGRTPGVEAFLDGRLFVRGNLTLPLELDDLLDVDPAFRDVRSPRCHRVLAGGVRTFYLESGPSDAPPVVLFHGLGATSTSFLPLMWDLARDYRVISVDLPGFGESGKPVRPLHAAYFARWAVAFLDALAIDRAYLIGNSMGGRVALEVALRHPERAIRLGLLTPSLAWRRFRIAAGLVRILRPELAVLPIPMLHALVLQSIRTMFARPDRLPPAAMNGAADEFVRYFRTTRGRIAFFSAAREIYLEDPHGRRGFWNRLSKLEVPSLFVFGKQDRLVSHRFQRYVQRSVPHATCELLDDCGHVPQFELPERTNALVRAFFAAANA